MKYNMIFTFLWYENEENDDVIDCSTKTVQHSINNISRNIEARVLQTWHQKCASQKEGNDTLHVVAMVTLLAPVSFCENQITPFPTLKSGIEGLSPNTHGSHMVLTLHIKLLGVDDPCLR